jgi:Sap, sulfolipid-1-addressing protein
MGDILALAVTAAFNPTLFAATMVMLLSTNAKRLMLGYLLGSYLVSITLGLVIVFALPNTSTVSTTRNTLSPALDIAFGLIFIVIAVVIGSGPHDRVQSRREKQRLKRAEKGPPRWRRTLDKGSARASFVVGALLSFPGASYLVALDILHKHDLGAGAVVAIVIGFCLIMLAILEVPLLGYAFAPEGTVETIERFKAWITTGARRIATRASLVIGALLLLRGAIELIS